MDKHTSHELAYKNGYEDGKRDAAPKRGFGDDLFTVRLSIGKTVSQYGQTGMYTAVTDAISVRLRNTISVPDAERICESRRKENETWRKL